MSARRRKLSVRELGQSGPKLFQQYLAFLCHDRGLAEGTIHHRKAPVLGLLKAHPEYATPSRIGRVSARMIHQYIIQTAKPFSREKKRTLITGVRDFFKFVYLKGYHPRNLAQAVPTLITYRLDRVPRALAWESVEKLLQVPDRSQPIGRRDYALLLLFAT